MYWHFFKLERAPFALSPDPYFLCPTAAHEEALARLYYGIQQRLGCLMLTGEVGTGKTLMARCLLERLQAQGLAFSYIFDPRLRRSEFWRFVLHDLGLELPEKDQAERLLRLQTFLIARHRLGQTTVLVVDEAQQLPWSLLEEIRLLTNLETPRHKLLQVILLGQPELERQLNQPRLRQLRQRISLRCRLMPLTPAETREYILRRLERAGADPRAAAGWFTAETSEAIQQASGGIPRLINLLCDQALLAAYARQQRRVDSAQVAEIATEMQLQAMETTAA